MFEPWAPVWRRRAGLWSLFKPQLLPGSFQKPPQRIWVPFSHNGSIKWFDQCYTLWGENPKTFWRTEILNVIINHSFWFRRFKTQNLSSDVKNLHTIHQSRSSRVTTLKPSGGAETKRPEHDHEIKHRVSRCRFAVASRRENLLEKSSGLRKSSSS